MKPVAGHTPANKLIEAHRRKSAVQKFLDEGFPIAKAVRLAAMYLATLRKMDSKSATASEKLAASATDVALSPIWTAPKGLAPHERVAARIAEFGRLTSEKAHQKAAEVARHADATAGG